MAGNDNSGRNPILDEEMIEALCKAKESGLPNGACCDYVGIGETAFYGYFNKAKEDEAKGKTEETSIYMNFAKRFKKSQAKLRGYHIDLINKASKKGNWQASAWYLERCFPKEFGRNVIIKDETSNSVLDKLATALEGLCENDETATT